MIRIGTFTQAENHYMQAIADIADSFKAGLFPLLPVINCDCGGFPFKRFGLMKPDAMFLYIGGKFLGVMRVFYVCYCIYENSKNQGNYVYT